MKKKTLHLPGLVTPRKVVGTPLSLDACSSAGNFGSSPSSLCASYPTPSFNWYSKTNFKNSLLPLYPSLRQQCHAPLDGISRIQPYSTKHIPHLHLRICHLRDRYLLSYFRQDTVTLATIAGYQSDLYSWVINSRRRPFTRLGTLLRILFAGNYVCTSGGMVQLDG